MLNNLLMLPDVPVAVIPAIAGPMQALMAILPGLLLALLGLIVSIFRPSNIRKLLRILWRVKWTLIPLAAVIFAANHLADRLFRSRGTSEPAVAADYDWPTFGRTPQRTGAVPGAAGPVRGGTQWSFIEDLSYFSSPVVVGNRVYAVSAEKTIYSDRGFVSCFDADTGELIWRTRPDGMRATFSSPAVVGDRLVVGEGLHWTTDARVFVLDISEEGRGKLLWKYQVDGYVESSPTVADGKIYIGAGSAGIGDGYYCFDLEPDENGDPRLLWHAGSDRYPGAEASPAHHENKVYIPMGYGGKPGLGNGVACLDAETGEEIWYLNTPFPVRTSPAVYGGRLFFGMAYANYVQTAEEALNAQVRLMEADGAGAEEIAAVRREKKSGGAVWGVNLEDPEDRWEFSTSRSVMGAITVDEEGLYFGSWDDDVVLLSHQGGELNRWNAHGAVLASPSLSGDMVYVVNNHGRLYGLKRKTLEPVWETRLGEAGLYVSSPAIAHGHVYVGTPNNGVLKVGLPAETDTASPLLWQGSRSAGLRAETLPEIGNFLWNWPEGAENPLTGNIRTQPAWADDKLLLPIAEGGGAGVAALTPGSEQGPALIWHYAAPGGVHTPPLADAEQLWIAEGKPGTGGRRLTVLDLETGAARWSRPLGEQAAGPLALDREGLLVQMKNGTFSRLRSDGEIEWEIPLPGERLSASMRHSLLAVTAAEPNRLLLIDAPTGALIWEIVPEHAPLAAPYFFEDRLVLMTEGGIQSLRLFDGGMEWMHPVPSPRGLPALQGSLLAYRSGERGLEVLDLRGDGEEMFHDPDAVDLSPMWADGQLVYATAESLRMYQPGESRSGLWLDRSWMGSLLSPLLGAGSEIYFATDELGFIASGEWK